MRKLLGILVAIATLDGSFLLQGPPISGLSSRKHDRLRKPRFAMALAGAAPAITPRSWDCDPLVGTCCPMAVPPIRRRLILLRR
jgi:hypothetical protein